MVVRKARLLQYQEGQEATGLSCLRICAGLMVETEQSLGWFLLRLVHLECLANGEPTGSIHGPLVAQTGI